MAYFPTVTDILSFYVNKVNHKTPALAKIQKAVNVLKRRPSCDADLPQISPHFDLAIFPFFDYSVTIPTPKGYISLYLEVSDMQIRPFPVIDPVATGKNILRLRNARGMSVRDMQAFFGFDAPQAIYKWQQGTSLPTVDNLYALSALLEVPMEEILIPAKTNITKIGQQDASCCPVHIHLSCSSIAAHPSSIWRYTSEKFPEYQGSSISSSRPANCINREILLSGSSGMMRFMLRRL